MKTLEYSYAILEDEGVGVELHKVKAANTLKSRREKTNIAFIKNSDGFLTHHT